MNDNPSRVLSAIVALGNNPDAVELDVRNGHLQIVLGTSLILTLDLADRDTIEKLAVVAAEAAVVKRSRELWQVA